MAGRKVAVLASHTSSQRDSWWYLVQDADGTLHVEYENDDDHSDDRRISLNEFLQHQGGSAARNKLIELIARMFEERESDRT